MDVDTELNIMPKVKQIVNDRILSGTQVFKLKDEIL